MTRDRIIPAFLQLKTFQQGKDIVDVEKQRTRQDRILRHLFIYLKYYS